MGLFEQLKNKVESEVLPTLEALGWDCNIESQSESPAIFTISASVGDRIIRFAIITSTAIKHQFYKDFAESCDRVYYTGALYKIDDYRKDAKIEVVSITRFFSDFVEENRTINEPSNLYYSNTDQGLIDIVSEDVLRSLYQHLDRYCSAELCMKFISEKCDKHSIDLSEDVIRKKAQGVSFSVRQALQYFRGGGQSLSSKIISLYYGTISFAFAEILASPYGSESLQDLENVTKNGHGLYTIPSENADFADMWVGVLQRGFFSKWAAHCGFEVRDFPTARIKSAEKAIETNTHYCIRIADLFANFPEIEMMFRELFTVPNNWVTPFPPSPGDGPDFMSRSEKHANSSYMNFYDPSGTVDLRSLAKAKLPLSELRQHSAKKGPFPHSQQRFFQGRVDHDGLESAWPAIPVQRSPFGDTKALVLPSLGGIADYQMLAAAAMYSLTIIVRYLPSTWQSVEAGSGDKYMPMISTFVESYQRIALQNFLGRLSEANVYCRMPGAWG